MSDNFGIFSRKTSGVTFDSIEVFHGDNVNNKNHPDKEKSPNKEKDLFRLEGYPNPILGDEGYGQIKRWSKINRDTLDNITEQIIEHYLKDIEFYGRVSCREALWNMYRRLMWWLKNQTDPQKAEYQNTMELVKDCIYKVLDGSKTIGGDYMGVDLPHCPMPFIKTYGGDYFNDFNNIKQFIVLLSTKDEPSWSRLPGLFRYMSSSEDIFWTIDKTSSENIIKFDINQLEETQSSKMGFYWRFKNAGHIKFTYKVSSVKGNGVSFFINGKHVGGEWHDNDWTTVTYNLYKGQTLRFDWLIRNQSGRMKEDCFVYIKDIECVEKIDTIDVVTKKTDVSWKINRNYGIATVKFGGTTSPTSPEMTLSIDLDEAGAVEFDAYKLATTPTVEISDPVEIISDSFVSKVFKDSTWNETVVEIDHGNWAYDGSKAVTKDSGKIVATLGIKPETSVEITGSLQMTCPAPNSIPLGFDESKIKTFSDFTWSASGGQSLATYPIKVVGGKIVVNTNAPNGTYSINTEFTAQDDGYIMITHSQTLLAGDYIRIILNGDEIEKYQGTLSSEGTLVPLDGSPTAQTLTIEFFKSSGLVTPLVENISQTIALPYTSLVEDDDFISANYTATNKSKVQHKRYLKNISLPDTLVNQDEVTYTVTLAPNSNATFSESVQVIPEPANPVVSTVFNETFDGRKINTDIIPSSNWVLTNLSDVYGDFIKPLSKDVIYVKKENSVNTLKKPVFSLASAGKLTFDYGGKFTNKDKLELYVTNNGKRTLRWSGNLSTQNSDSKNSISLDLLSGANELEWVYTDSLADKDVCYSAGSEKILINYLDGKEVETKRGLTHNWEHLFQAENKKNSFYTERGITNEATSYNTRRFIYNFPKFSTVSYEENLTVYRGSKTEPVFGGGGSTDIKLQQPFYNNNLKYYAKRLDQLTPDDKESFYTNYFYVDGKVSMSFDYECLIYDMAKVPYEARQKAIVGIKMVHENGQIGLQVANFDKNSTTKDRDVDNLTGTWGGKYTKEFTPSTSGNYRLVISITDTVSDYNSTLASASGDLNRGEKAQFSPDGKYLDQFFAIKNMVVNNNLIQTGTKTVYDDTKVIVNVKKVGRSAPLWTSEYSSTDEKKATVTAKLNLNFSDFQKQAGDGTYFVEYILKRGDLTSGGFKGTGGGFSLSGGFYEEKYPAYCVTSNGKEYLKTDPILKDTWCYLDNIKVTQLIYVAPTPDYNFSVFLSGSKIQEIKTPTETSINIPLVNSTNQSKVFTIRYNFKTTNKEKAITEDAKIVFTQQKTTNPSYAEFTVFDLYKKVQIFGGGCGTSTLKAILYDGTGNVISTHLVTPNDLNNNFIFNIPSSSVYSNSRLEIISEMNSEYLLRQTFQVKDISFKVTQKATSDYFSSSLQVYIDGELKGSYQEPGTVSIPVSKGKHEIKWVFKRNNFKPSNNDEVALDWVRVTNWMVEKVNIIPHCDEGGGDKCIEALIRCLLDIWKNKPTTVTIGSKIWLFT